MHARLSNKREVLLNCEEMQRGEKSKHVFKFFFYHVRKEREIDSESILCNE